MKPTELVFFCFFFALRGFSPGIPAFPSPQKPTFPNFNSIRIQVDEELLCGSTSSKQLFIYLFYPILSYPVLSCPVLSCPVLSYPVLSRPILSCPVLSCPVLSCPVLSYLILSYLILFYYLFIYLFIYFTQAEIHASPKQDPQAVATSVYWLQKTRTRMVIPVTVRQASFCSMITRHVIPQVTLSLSRCNSFLKSPKSAHSRRVSTVRAIFLGLCLGMCPGRSEA